MQQHKTDLERKNVRVAVITFEAGYFARVYVEESGLDWPLLVDESREIYKAYGMLDAGFWDIWGPSTLWAYAKEIARGRLPKKPHGDVRQRGGDVLIDPSGTVRFHHIGKGPADRPPVETLVAAVKEH